MITLKIGRQAERAGIDPTLSVMVAKGVALEKLGNQYTRNVCEEYANNGSNPLFYCLIYHFIFTLPSRARLPSLYPNFIKWLVNQQREEPSSPENAFCEFQGHPPN